MRNILVLTDFSDAALHASFYARLLYPTLSPQKILLFHCPGSEADNKEQAEAGQWQNEKLQELEKIKMLLLTDSSQQMTVETLVGEQPVVDHINEICEQYEVDLVVMGTKGSGKNTERLVGSTTAAIINAARYPILSVPESAPLTPAKDILFASDLQAMDGSVEERISRLINLLHPKLYVLNVDRKEKEFGPDTSFELRQLHYLLDKYHPEFIFTEDADTAEGVERIAADKQAAMIITIHRKHGWLYNLLHSSFSAALALYTDKVMLSLYNE